MSKDTILKLREEHILRINKEFKKQLVNLDKKMEDKTLAERTSNREHQELSYIYQRTSLVLKGYEKERKERGEKE